MMRYRQILKHLRLIVLIVLGLLSGSVIGGLYYLNQSGVNEEWRLKIAEELEHRGIIVDFESLRYDLSLGLVAKGVRIYKDDSRQIVVARLEHLVIDLDKTKLMRGKFHVNNLSVEKGRISFLLDSNDPNSLNVVISDLKGSVYWPNKNTMEARGVSGVLFGVKLDIDAYVWSRNLKDKSKIALSSKEKKTLSPEKKKAKANALKLISDIVLKIEQWHWSKGKTPELKIYAEGNLDDLDSAHLNIDFSAQELERSGVKLKDIRILAEYNNKMVTVDKIALRDDFGIFEASVDFLPRTKRGSFKAKSSLDLKRFSEKIFGIHFPYPIDFVQSPKINCEGSVQFDAQLKPKVEVLGELGLEKFTFLGVPFEQLKSDISMEGSNMYLTNLKIKHEKGAMNGRVLVKDGTIRYEMKSTLPASSFSAFILNPLAKKAFKKAKFSSLSKVNISSVGLIHQTSPLNWSIAGECSIENFSYKGVKLKKAKAYYFSSQKELKFSKIQLVLDHRDYILRKKYGGPSTGYVNADSVVVDMKDKMVHIDNVRATVWPVPVVRLFHDASADHCEQYQFFRPPILRAGGSFDLHKNQKRTDFKINLSIPGSTHYSFLGEFLTLRNLRGQVRIRKNKVDVNHLSFFTFQGKAQGEVHVNIAQKSYNGSFHWDKLHLKDLGKLYHFHQADRGLITGRIDYHGKSKDIKSFNGKGVIALERGNLFSVPMLGPLSPVIGSILGKKNLTNEQAENASCSYVIQNGVVFSNDFLATTRSLRFTGEGKIELDTKKINLLVRMNARGLLGIITFPLNPFMGMFQFKGTGTLSDSKWKPSLFTTPKKGKNDPIFRKPPKARMISE